MTTTAPKTRDIETHTLLDLVPAGVLQKIQDSFAAAAEVGSVIVDLNGNALTRSSSFSRVCDLVGATPLGAERCRKSNEVRHSMSIKSDRPVHLQCLSCGFVDASAPIVVDGVHVADWLMGQCDVHQVGDQRIREYAREIGADESAMIDAYHSMKPVPLERFEKLLGLLWQYAQTLSSLGFTNLQLRRDIEARRQMESAREESEEKYTSLFHSSNDAIFIHDLHGHIVDANARAIDQFGYSEKELLSLDLAKLHPEEMRSASEDAFRAVTRDGFVRFEIDFLRKTGERFTAEVSSSLFEIGNEKVVQGIVRDKTEQLRAARQELELREQLERAQRMESLGMLAGGVAHDLNNMLGPLVGYPQLMLAKLPDDSPVRKYVKSMGQAAAGAAEVIQDLLTLARRGQLEMTPVDLNEVAESYLNSPPFLKLSASQPGITVRRNLASTVAAVSGSFTHLVKMLSNLVNTAYESMEGTGELMIETSRKHLDTLKSGYDRIEPGEYIQLTVRDTGHGISPDDLPSIFEPYFSRQKHGHGGTGLGLAVVYGVIRDHGGYYDVFSAVGRGTEFVIYLPAIVRPVADRPVGENMAGGTETIMIVDDSDDQRELGVELLTSLGYTVVTACNGHVAVELLRKQPVDLVLLDMIMEEDFDGLDTYRTMLTIAPDQKAVIVSGYASTERVQEARDLGVGAYVRKPYLLNILAETVRRELDRRVAPVSS